MRCETRVIVQQLRTYVDMNGLPRQRMNPQGRERLCTTGSAFQERCSSKGLWLPCARWQPTQNVAHAISGLSSSYKPCTWPFTLEGCRTASSSETPSLHSQLPKQSFTLTPGISARACELLEAAAPPAPATLLTWAITTGGAGAARARVMSLGSLLESGRDARLGSLESMLRSAILLHGTASKTFFLLLHPTLSHLLQSLGSVPERWPGSQIAARSGSSQPNSDQTSAFESIT